MADALCGPANPLQSLQKHTQIDRTLQQDRLVGPRQSPAQGFRTADPRAGAVDADFHAFEHSSPSPFQFQQHDFTNTLNSHPAQFHPSTGGWATDFQRLNINEQPLPSQQFRMEAPLVRSNVGGGWHAEFIRQRSNASTPLSTISQGKQAVRDQQPNMYSPQMMNFPQGMASGGFYNNSTFFPAEQQQQQLQPQDHHQMSDVDFEAAFSDALAHAQEMDQAKLEAHEPQQEEPAQAVSPADHIRIGSDTISYREKDQRTADQDKIDADELARTAGQLLTSVQHDTSSKFQNSNFLDLMRRIRDREVEVQNNDLTNVRTGETAAGNLPNQETSNLNNIQEKEQSNSQFSFPNMDGVYAPTAADLSDEIQTETSWNTTGAPTSTSAGPTSHQSPYTTYGFGDGQVNVPPYTQVQALHPGGPNYPDRSPPQENVRMDTSMTGAVGGGRDIHASDFDYTDESADLARRFR